LNVARQRLERFAGETDLLGRHLKLATVSLDDKNLISLQAQYATVLAKDLDRMVQVGATEITTRAERRGRELLSVTRT
jgi:hypothetical protein